MSGITALKAAYIATWVIQLGYVAYLVGRLKRVRQEMTDFKRGE
jgi:CcmD family protein